MWRSWDKERLDKEYSPSQWSHRMGPADAINSHVQVVTQGSEVARSSFEHQSDLVYGPGDRQKLDIFAPRHLPKDAPIFVYIHGGYWQFLRLGRQLSSFMVLPFVRAGAVVVAVGYDLAPVADMDSIVAQIRMAMKYILEFAKQRGSRGVYVCGHSAGGHLTSMLMATHWESQFKGLSHLIKGAIPVSGVFDLRPLVTTYVNEPLGMTEDVAWKNSANNHLELISKQCKAMRLLVVVGQHDPPTFRQQSLTFYKSMLANGIEADHIEVQDTDHFNVIERLSESDYALTKKILKMMDL